MSCTSPAFEFHLLHAPLHAGGTRGTLPVSAAGTWLHRSGADQVAISPDRPRGVDGMLLFLEPLCCRRPPVLLAVSPGGNRGLRVNGGWAPSLIVLHEKDELLAPSILETPLLVTRFIEQVLGPAPAGGTCPVCRTEIRHQARVYRCPCGTALHAEDAKDNGLNCVEFAESCPSCGTAVLDSAGYTWVPEDLA